MMKKKHTIRILTLMMMVCAMLGAYPHTAEAASKDTQARNAYAKYMSAKNIWWVDQYFPSSKFEFAIMDMNNDDVPELYIENHGAYGYQGNGDVYTYRNGKMQKMYHFGNSQSMRAYYPGRGVFLDDGGRMGYYPCYYVKMNASGQATAQIASILRDEFKDGKRKEVTRYYKISSTNKEIEISKSEFNKRKQSLVGKTAPKKPVLRKNTAANRKKYLLPKTSGSSVKLNKTSVTLYLDTNKTYQLKATITGASRNAKWTSSNKKIVTVTSKGKITAKKAGTAYITVQANGKTAKCKVTVKNKKITNKYLKQIQGTWYTLGGLPYHAKYVFDGTNVKRYHYGDKKPWAPASVDKIYETSYGCYIRIRDMSGGRPSYYGYRLNKDEKDRLHLIGHGDPYSESGYSGTDSLVRKK